jgi:DNA-directed RNA polymerase subunit RPC12/RpoP
MGLRVPNMVDVTCLTDTRKREVVAAYDTTSPEYVIACSYCKSTIRWAEYACRSCGAAAERPKESPPAPADDCCSGEDPR